MKKLSKPLMIGVGAVVAILFTVLAVFIVANEVAERPVEAQSVQTPASEVQKAVKVTDPKSMKVDKNFQTGWTQLEDSIEISLSGPDNCLPEIEKATREGKTVSIWLKDKGDDCTNTTAVVYSTIEDAKDVEKVQMYQAGYRMPFELFELPAK
jgi:hypothetical protein